MERPNTFAVQTGIFGKALQFDQFQSNTFHANEHLHTTYLADEHRHAMRNKVPDCPGISVQVTARETLVRRVKECIVPFRQKDARDGFPLLFRGVNARGVVRARMQ